MNFRFKSSSILPDENKRSLLLCDLPAFNQTLSPAKINIYDTREDVKRGGHGPSPMVPLRQAAKATWRFRNHTVIEISGALCVAQGILTRDGEPVLGVATISWERENAQLIGLSARVTRLTGNVTRHRPGRTAILLAEPTNNYFHFTRDVATRLPYMRDLVEKHGFERIVVTTPAWAEGSFQQAMAKMILGDSFKFLEFDTLPFTTDVAGLFLDRCRFYERDESTGEITIRHAEDMHPTQSLSGLGRVFDDLLAAGDDSIASPEPILLISREKAAYRRIVNEAALLSRISDFGVKKVFLEDMDLPAQISMIRSRRIVIGCHGAGMLNAAYLPRGSHAVELTSRQYARRARDFGGISPLRGLRYDFVLCDEYGNCDNMIGNIGNDLFLSDAALDCVEDICRDSLSSS